MSRKGFFLVLGFIFLTLSRMWCLEELADINYQDWSGSQLAWQIIFTEHHKNPNLWSFLQNQSFNLIMLNTF